MRYQSDAGFGLLEVVISAGILATVIGASVGLMNSSLRRATLAADRATAMYLAQEGVELVRAARDTAYVDRQSNLWIAYFNVLSSGEGTPKEPGTDSYALTQTVPPGGGAGAWSLVKAASRGTADTSTITQGIEQIPVGTLSYQREIYVTKPGIDYQTVGSLPDGVTEDDVIRKVTVIVRWGPSAKESVTSIVFLTSWRGS